MATVTLDVREDIRNGEEPFSKIMSAVSGLGKDDAFELIAPFEPVPLYSVMRQRGFENTTEQTQSGDWKVTFFRP